MDPDAVLALAHALRTPLTSLALGLGLLDEGALGPLTEAQREVVRVLVADVARLSLIVDRRLATERLGAHAGPVERARIDIRSLVDQAVGPLAEQAATQGIALECACDDDVAAVLDPVKMGWVVVTLLGNALRYSTPGGRVAVRVTRQDDEAEIAITDQGPGMAGEVAVRIFERGGGLGLYLIREIVEAHGGNIQVESAPGHGSTFVVRLPAGP